MKRYIFFPALLWVSTVLLSGCGPMPPEGFPRLRPAKIRVLDGTTPVPNVNIVLVPETGAMNLLIAATTDGNGVAVIRTMRGTFGRPGAPEGTYRVRLDEIAPETIEPNLIEDEQLTPQQIAEREREDRRRHAEAEAARKVPTVLGDVQGTPLKCEIDHSGISLDIDISQYKSK